MALSSNARGAVFMACSMAGFTINDALTKSALATMNAGQVMFVRGAMTTFLVYLVARRLGGLEHLGRLIQPYVMLRIFFETLAAITYLSALGQIPLANASAILQALPLAVTLGAAVFLREPVGWRRWTAIIIGFLGVMIIIRPGPEGFTLASLYVVFSVLTAAARDIVTKRIDPAIPSISVTLVTAASISAAGTLLIQPMGGWEPMTWMTTGTLFLAAAFLFVGYQMIIMAMRIGEISFIAPFRYTSLVWAVALGMIFFGELPDMWMAVGTAIVIGSGLYTFYRENKRKAQSASQSLPISPS